MKQHNRTGIVRHLAGIAALAVLAVGCSGSSGDGEAEVTVPLTDPVVEAPVTAAPVTAAPVVTEPAAEEPAVDPGAIPELPCAEYVDESGFPLKPCDKGVLVERLQRDLESLFPAIAIDGLFGGQTAGFIEEIQTANGLDVTGLVSEDLAGQIATAEAIDQVGAGGAAPPAEPDATNEVEEPEEAAVEAVSEEICNDLIGKPEDPNFNAETIEACSALGVDLVGEG